MNVLIVDDEPLAREILENYVSKIPEVNLVASIDNPIEVSNILAHKDIDLLLLDIHMPSISGIDLVKSLSKPPKIIFTTAYPEHAVEGFELNAEDYLVKPISFERFYKAIQNVLEQLRLEKSNSSSQPEEDHIYVKADKKLQKVFYNDIYYIEGLKDYVILKLENERIVTLQTMKSLIGKLPESIFKRIHRSYIINLNRIDALYGNVVEMRISGKEVHLPIGKNYKDDLVDFIHRHKL